MKVLLVSPKNKTVYNFRGDLVRAIVAGGHEVVVTGPNREHIEDIMALGVSRFAEIPLAKDRISVWGDVAYLTRLRSVMVSERPDVVFAYTPKPVIYGCIAARLARVPRVCPMVTGLGTVFRSSAVKHSLVQRIMRIQYKLAFAFSHAVVLQNPDDAQVFISAGLVSPQKVVLVDGSGVNLERFDVRALPEGPSFLFIGRLIRDKGIVEYLNACAEVRRRYPNVECHVVGAFDTNPSAYSRAELEPLLDAGVVRYHGEQSDVRPFIENATVFVLPSYHEGTPRSVLEAMAMGRAVITTDAPGCRETVHDGVNGYLVRPGDATELASRMEALVAQPELVRRMGRESRRLAESRYDVHKVNAIMLETLGLTGASQGQ